MSGSDRKFLLDSNVLMTARRTYYAFDLCPGFWQSILDGHKAGRIFSTERVKKELLKGNDELTDWAELFMPDEFFSGRFNRRHRERILSYDVLGCGQRIRACGAGQVCQ